MFKTTFLAIAAVAGLSVMIAAPASARDRSDAENRRCLAVGMTMTSLAKTEREVVDMLKEAQTSDATQEDKDTLAQLDELATSTASVGEALETIYHAAPKPDQAELDELNNMAVDKLIDEADKCVDD